MKKNNQARRALSKVFGGVGTFSQKGSDPPEAGDSTGWV